LLILSGGAMFAQERRDLQFFDDLIQSPTAQQQLQKLLPKDQELSARGFGLRRMITRGVIPSDKLISEVRSVCRDRLSSPGWLSPSQGEPQRCQVRRELTSDHASATPPDQWDAVSEEEKLCMDAVLRRQGLDMTKIRRRLRKRFVLPSDQPIADIWAEYHAEFVRQAEERKQAEGRKQVEERERRQPQDDCREMIFIPVPNAPSSLNVMIKGLKNVTRIVNQSGLGDFRVFGIFPWAKDRRGAGDFCEQLATLGFEGDPFRKMHYQGNCLFFAMLPIAEHRLQKLFDGSIDPLQIGYLGIFADFRGIDKRSIKIVRHPANVGIPSDIVWIVELRRENNKVFGGLLSGELGDGSGKDIKWSVSRSDFVGQFAFTEKDRNDVVKTLTEVLATCNN
jgi:hypothetical protein